MRTLEHFYKRHVMLDFSSATPSVNAIRSKVGCCQAARRAWHPIMELLRTETRRKLYEALIHTCTLYSTRDHPMNLDCEVHLRRKPSFQLGPEMLKVRYITKSRIWCPKSHLKHYTRCSHVV